MKSKLKNVYSPSRRHFKVWDNQTQRYLDDSEYDCAINPMGNAVVIASTVPDADLVLEFRNNKKKLHEPRKEETEQTKNSLLKRCFFWLIWLSTITAVVCNFTDLVPKYSWWWCAAPVALCISLVVLAQILSAIISSMMMIAEIVVNKTTGGE